MDKIITAPKIRNYAHWLCRMGYRSYDCQCSYDSESYLLINAIFDELKKSNQPGTTASGIYGFGRTEVL